MRNPIVADWAGTGPIPKQLLSSQNEEINNYMVSFIRRLLPGGNVLLLRQMRRTTALLFTADDTGYSIENSWFNFRFEDRNILQGLCEGV